MTARHDPAPLGDSRDNATRDARRQARSALADLEQKYRAGLITREEYDAMRSIHE